MQRTRAKLHSSGHLISNVVEAQYPEYKAVKGHHFPGECYVEFSMHNQAPHELDLEALNAEIKVLIENELSLETIYISGDEVPKYCPNLPYSIPKTENVRLIKMAQFDYQPCGGTHVKSSLELKGLCLSKSKLKGNSLKINYHII